MAEMGVLTMYRNPVNGYRLIRRSDIEVFLKPLCAEDSDKPRQAR